MRVLLVAGGWSPEREVSLSGARGIHSALEQLGHEVLPFDPSESLDDLPRAARQADFAFLNLHGSPGEDGLIQAMLDQAGCPYQGSGPAGSFLALNKAASKAVIRHAGLPTADWKFLPAMPNLEYDPGLGWPLIAKPNAGGSSLGMSLVRTVAELPKALEKIYSMGEEALLERLVPGDEITCSVLGGAALPLILIRPADTAEFFDYESKYQPGKAEEICPAPVDKGLTDRLQAMALDAHRVLGLYGYSRTDFMVENGEPFILEVNTLPGMTATSLLPQAAAETGLDFPGLIARLMEQGLERGKEQSK